MQARATREWGADWWEVPGRRERDRRQEWWAGATRTALRLESVLLVLCLVIATLTNDESVELFFPLALLGTPLVIFATMALLLFRFLTTGARGRSRAATEGAPACTCPLGAGPRGTLDARDTALPAARLTEEQRLRRRYIAGELTDSEFQLAIMMLGKERVTRGQLSLSEYELELDRLLSRARGAAKTDVLQAKPPAADGA